MPKQPQRSKDREGAAAKISKPPEAHLPLGSREDAYQQPR
jgi:hypothetical protein